MKEVLLKWKRRSGIDEKNIAKVEAGLIKRIIAEMEAGLIKNV